MAHSLTFALCVDGVDDEELVAAAMPWISNAERVEVWCGYGDEARRELEHARERHGRPRPPHPPRDPHHEDVPDREQAEAIAQAAVDLLRERGIAATTRVLSDRDAGHAVAAATTPEIAVLLGSGHRGGIGPKSIGHIARFIIDHAAGPAIVLKLS